MRLTKPHVVDYYNKSTSNSLAEWPDCVVLVSLLASRPDLLLMYPRVSKQIVERVEMLPLHLCLHHKPYSPDIFGLEKRLHNTPRHWVGEHLEYC